MNPKIAEPTSPDQRDPAVAAFRDARQHAYDPDFVWRMSDYDSRDVAYAVLAAHRIARDEDGRIIKSNMGERDHLA